MSVEIKISQHQIGHEYGNYKENFFIFPIPMNAFRLGSSLLIAVLCINIVSAQLVYDPVTNTYKNASSTTSSSSSSSSTTTTTATTNTETETWSTVVSSIPADKNKTSTSTTNTGTTQTTTPSVAYTTPDPAIYKGVLSAMHVQLDQHTKTVMDKLTVHLNNLDISKSASLQQAADRLRILTCLGVISPTTNIYDVLKTSATSLQNSIEIVNSDMHGDISALEEKITKGLLDKLIQQLEISSMQNKIDSFATEYTNVVDLFFEVSIGEVETVENLFTNLSPQAKKDLDSYTKTSDAYNAVMSAYETFLSKSSFANVVAWPHLHELIELTNGLKTYRRSVLLSDRQNKVVAYAPLGTVGILTEQKKVLTQDFSLLFNEATQKVLGNLYPIDELLLLNQQIMWLRSAYTDESNGFADCRAFVENPTVTITGPELQKYMDTLLTDLNTAVNKVASNNTAPKTKEELLSGLKKEITTQAEDMIDSLITTHKTKLKEKLESAWRALMSVASPSSSSKLEGAVRSYLQKKYLAALEANTLSEFQDKLLSISSKIDKKLADGSLSATQTKLLITIETIVNEFLG